MSAEVQIISLDAPVADNALDQLADVLVDCVEGGASVSFMSPFSHQQALAFFRETHGSLMRKLGTLSDADLQRPYNHYQPNDRRDASDNRPVVDWVAGNTWEHYAEHIGWINQLVKDSSASR